MDFKGDIQTNGAHKSVQDKLLKKDNVAIPDARSFDNKVGDTMSTVDGKKQGKFFLLLIFRKPRGFRNNIGYCVGIIYNVGIILEKTFLNYCYAIY